MPSTQTVRADVVDPTHAHEQGGQFFAVAAAVFDGEQGSAKIAALEFHVIPIPSPERTDHLPCTAGIGFLAEILGQADDFRVLGFQSRGGAVDLVAHSEGVCLANVISSGGN